LAQKIEIDFGGGIKMATSRQVLQLVGKTATAAMLLGNRDAVAGPNEAPHLPIRRGRQLLELEQQFEDLRFGMFLHFNMATFQDREWGDPTSSPDLFHPTALDPDQWAAAAQSANMTRG
jgi:alpha-L-fucosidase